MPASGTPCPAAGTVADGAALQATPFLRPLHQAAAHRPWHHGTRCNKHCAPGRYAHARWRACPFPLRQAWQHDGLCRLAWRNRLLKPAPSFSRKTASTSVRHIPPSDTEPAMSLHHGSLCQPSAVSGIRLTRAPLALSGRRPGRHHGSISTMATSITLVFVGPVISKSPDAASAA